MNTLLSRLTVINEQLSQQLHTAMRQRMVVREALTRLRTGQPPDVVAALVRATCPELNQEPAP